MGPIVWSMLSLHCVSVALLTVYKDMVTYRKITENANVKTVSKCKSANVKLQESINKLRAK